MDRAEEDVGVGSEVAFNDALLVETVAKYPALYNLKLAEYHNILIKARCWEMVSQVMNESVAKCMARWIRLKDNFRREKNKREQESRSGQGLSQRKGFSLYASMSFMRSNIVQRKTFNNAKSSSAGIKKTKTGNSDFQFTANATSQTQYQCTSWNQVPPTTSNYLDTIFPMLRTSMHQPSTHVSMPPTTVPMLLPTATATITSPVTIDTCLTNPNPSVQIRPPANVNEPARTFMTTTVVTSPAATFTTPTTTDESGITFTTPTPRSEPPILASVLTTVTEPSEILTVPTAASEPILTSTATTDTDIMPATIPSPPAKAAGTAATRISAANIHVPQSYPHAMLSPFNFHNATSPSQSNSSSPAPPSPADSVYSSIYPDLSSDFNVNTDTVHTRNSHASPQRENRFMKSPSASLSTSFTHGYSELNKSAGSVTPKACYNKDTRQKKLDPLEACMISLSNSIKGKLEAEPSPKQIAKTPDQVFGDMVAAELSNMSEEAKMSIKTLIVDILFARAK